MADFRMAILAGRLLWSVGASSSMAVSQRTQAPDVEKRGRAAGIVLLVFEAKKVTLAKRGFDRF